jgi:hypothetical protein
MASGSTFPPLNLHRARVRRNRGRLPSSRCIESAPEHHAFILILLLMRLLDGWFLSPGPEPSVFAYVKTTMHRNLYRIPVS